jgi:cell division septal protein FtsQ
MTMKDLSEISFSADAPPERFAAPARRPRGARNESRWRLLRSKERWVLALGACALVLAIVGAYYALREEPVFPLEEVVVEGQSRLTADEALGLTGYPRGTNLLAIDTEVARSAILAALPFVRDAVVERELPKRLRIRITERKPTLLVAMQHLYIADEQGLLYRRLQPGDKRTLPILTGLRRADIAARPRVVAEAIAGALELVRALDGRCSEEIAYHEVRGYSAMLCKGPEVRFGHPPFAHKLSNLERALGSTKRARVIHLDDERRPERVVVRIGRKGA